MPEHKPKPLSPSLEDYLEAALVLAGESGRARAADIARRLEVNRSAVTSAVKALTRRGLVEHEPYGAVMLTDRGRVAASKVARRHRLLREFFTGVLGLDAKTADANACRTEHMLDETVVDRMGNFTEFVQSRPGTPGQDMLDVVAQFREHERDARPAAKTKGRKPARKKRTKKAR